MENLLTTQNIKVYFPAQKSFFGKVKRYIKAVDDVTLHVNKGEIVSVVGESGCGKSTLGNTIIGLNKPIEGKIIFNSASVPGINSKHKDMQIIFQDPYSSLNPKHTLFEILSQPFLYHQVCSRENVMEYVCHLLEQVGLSKDYINRYPHAFSGGQRQRICIARAIGLKPKLIVCDEIVSSLDVSIQAQIIELLLELKNKFDLALLFISHDLSLVKTISDRIYVMYLGQIVESGPSNDIFERPKHPYTKALLESIPTMDKNTPPKILAGEVPSLSGLVGADLGASHLDASAVSAHRSARRTPLSVQSRAICRFSNRCVYKKNECVQSEPSLTKHVGIENKNGDNNDSEINSREYRCFFPLEY